MWLIALLAAAAALLAATAAAGQSTAHGRALLERDCSACHAVGSRGASPDRAAPRFRELGRRYPIDGLAEALAEGILTGHPRMPEFRFSPGQVADIIAYLKSIQTRQHAHLDGAAGPPAPG
jgi:mono/diheme cytochrome c family protein